MITHYRLMDIILAYIDLFIFPDLWGHECDYTRLVGTFYLCILIYLHSLTCGAIIFVYFDDLYSLMTCGNMNVITH